MTQTQYRKIVRASAIYDLIVTAPMALPWSFQWLLQCVEQLHRALRLHGAVPVYTTELALFANLMGSLVLVWSTLRALNPEPRLGRYDAAARALFSSWQLYAVLHGASAILLGFFVFEVLWGVAQLMPYSETNIGELQSA